MCDIFIIFYPQVVEADIFSADSLKTHFKGQDVIMSCLGFPTSFFSGVTGYTLSMKAMISAMREARVSRIITMTSWYTERKSSTPGDAFKAFSVVSCVEFLVLLISFHINSFLSF